MREEGATAKKRVRALTCETLETSDNLGRDVRGSKLADELVVIAEGCQAQNNQPKEHMRVRAGRRVRPSARTTTTHMPRATPSASTPPSTSQGVTFCSFAEPEAAAAAAEETLVATPVAAALAAAAGGARRPPMVVVTLERSPGCCSPSVVDSERSCLD